MKNLKIFIPFFLLAMVVVFACEEDQRGPVNDSDGSAPGPITEPQVENLAGAARISYTLPDDPNLLYVKAVYELRSGVQGEVKSSYYKNFMIVEGFGDTNEREITLYAVSRSEKMSSPVKVTIKPLPAPVYDVFNTLSINPTFGGILIGFQNPAATNGGLNSNIVISALLWSNETNEWRDIDTHYSGLKEEVYSIRGLAPVQQKFGFFMRDKWSNYTDTLTVEVTPIYEEELDKELWEDNVRGNSNYPVPQNPLVIGDLPASGSPMLNGVNYSGSYDMEKMWDLATTGGMYHTKQGVDLPVWNPWDLGVTAKLSRYQIWPRSGGSWAYNHGNPHEWQIYGTNTPEDPDSWILLDHKIMVKPSGLPPGQNTNDDNAINAAGIEYDFPLTNPPVRYISIKLIDNWASIGGQTGFMHIHEISIWGQKQ